MTHANHWWDELRESLFKKTWTTELPDSHSYFLRLCWLFLFLIAVTANAAVTPPSQPITLPPEQAAKEGKALVDEILSQKPAQNTTNNGVMIVRNSNDERRQIPVRFEVFSTPTNWISSYQANWSNRAELVSVVHTPGEPNRYFRARAGASEAWPLQQPLVGAAVWAPFAGSDFSSADLGLEFFHWPEQHLVRKEMIRSRSCKVLESINPHPESGAYSRVVSWIDNESDGIVKAQAYDAKGKILKEFIPKKIKKIEGQWQLEEMEIDNDQTDSSTRVTFDLGK